MEGLQSSLDYTNNLSHQPNQDSSASKLATAAGRRSDGGVILSPAQTLDQFRQFYVHQHQRQEPNNPDPDTIPDPDPPQLGAVPVAAVPNANTTPTPLPLPPPPQEVDVPSPIRCQYRECLKNHAASIGGHVVDGCGEFMPSGEEGTPEAFKCAACECHRNFHRRETEGGEGQQLTTTNHVYYPRNPNGINSIRTMNHHNQIPPQARHQHRNFPNHYSHSLASPSGPVMMAFGSRGPEESSSEDLNMFQSTGGGQHMVVPSSYSGSKKRFRTKFTKEQKDRMHEVAEKMGWKIQKQDDEEVQQLCQELGVKRQVFKVWMHNNKQAMKKKQDE
ncbi:zinc-finger homeodomain protein 2-like [Apium graveolens]|uniref:zinc-finger homeodomain protein 2-like n=1 Tax=Apium graveolens TaxID=4045 RepID=UPI003D7B6204